MGGRVYSVGRPPLRMAYERPGFPGRVAFPATNTNGCAMSWDTIYCVPTAMRTFRMVLTTVFAVGENTQWRRIINRSKD